jgi:hypothetical protein
MRNRKFGEELDEVAIAVAAGIPVSGALKTG